MFDWRLIRLVFSAAVFTARILAIKTHLLGCNGKDKHAKRRLAILESKRDRALHYLRRKDLPAFVEVGKALGVDLGRFSGF
jgi:ribosomal protein S15P/S13E